MSAGSVRVASLASRSNSVATGPSAQCTTFTRALGAGDHSASSRRAASELVHAQVRSPPVCCRLPVAQTHAHKSVTSPPTHTPRPLHVFHTQTPGERARVDVFIPAFAQLAHDACALAGAVSGFDAARGINPGAGDRNEHI